MVRNLKDLMQDIEDTGNAWCNLYRINNEYGWCCTNDCPAYGCGTREYDERACPFDTAYEAFSVALNKLERQVKEGISNE